MENATLNYKHLLNENGILFIEGTSTKDSELVVEFLACGWSPEEIHFQHPYLSLGKIYSAFAYYWDNKEKVEEEINNQYEIAEQLRKKLSSPLQEKLRNNPVHQ